MTGPRFGAGFRLRAYSNNHGRVNDSLDWGQCFGAQTQRIVELRTIADVACVDSEPCTFALKFFFDACGVCRFESRARQHNDILARPADHPAADCSTKAAQTTDQNVRCVLLKSRQGR